MKSLRLTARKVIHYRGVPCGQVENLLSLDVPFKRVAGLITCKECKRIIKENYEQYTGLKPLPDKRGNYIGRVAGVGR